MSAEVRGMTSTLPPVTPARIATATAHGIVGAATLADVCRKEDVPFFVACALVLKESGGGDNVYGHDAGGALSGYPHEVDESNFKVFQWLVETKGFKSNGVGPTQITYYPNFAAMAKLGLKPWVGADNLSYGLRLLRAQYDAHKTWESAGAHYNGGTKPDASAWAYGRDLVGKANTFRALFNLKGKVS